MRKRIKELCISTRDWIMICKQCSQKMQSILHAWYCKECGDLEWIAIDANGNLLIGLEKISKKWVGEWFVIDVSNESIVEK